MKNLGNDYLDTKAKLERAEQILLTIAMSAGEINVLPAIDAYFKVKELTR